MSKKDKRTVQRVMLAASRTPTNNTREAAILGGIVRSVIDTGHFNPKFVGHYTSEALRWFIKDIHVYEPKPKFGAPTLGEIKHVLQRFMLYYAGDGQQAA